MTAPVEPEQRYIATSKQLKCFEITKEELEAGINFGDRLIALKEIRQHPYPPKMVRSIREYLPRDLHFQPICIDKPCMGQIEICPCDDECDSVKQCAEHFHWLMENPDIAERNRKIADKIRDDDIAAYLARIQKDAPAQQRIADVIGDLEAAQRALGVGCIGAAKEWVDDAITRLREEHP